MGDASLHFAGGWPDGRTGIEARSWSGTHAAGGGAAALNGMAPRLKTVGAPGDKHPC